MKGFIAFLIRRCRIFLGLSWDRIVCAVRKRCHPVNWFEKLHCLESWVWSFSLCFTCLRSVFNKTFSPVSIMKDEYLIIRPCLETQNKKSVHNHESYGGSLIQVTRVRWRKFTMTALTETTLREYEVYYHVAEIIPTTHFSTETSVQTLRRTNLGHDKSDSKLRACRARSHINVRSSVVFVRKSTPSKTLSKNLSVIRLRDAESKVILSVISRRVARVIPACFWTCKETR